MAELALIGTLASAGGSLLSGLQQQKASKAEASQLEREGTAQLAASQRDMGERQRDTDELISKQVALAAASGAGVETPTILDIVGRTAQRGDYLARSELYAGQQRQAGAFDQAAAARARGRTALATSILGAVGGVGKAAYGYKTGYRNADDLLGNGKKKPWWFDQEQSS